MKIEAINDLVSIKDGFGLNVVIAPYMFQSCEIISYRDNQYVIYIRYGNTVSEAGYADCFCITRTYKTGQEVEDIKSSLLKALTIAKSFRR